ncbi:MAG: hypothetical protein ACI9TY_000165 [Alphaproteobacteria bacterium]|jgi:uncharacterized protein (DUF736 family)
MSNIGKIIEKHTNGKIFYSGRVSTLQLNLKFWFEENNIDVEGSSAPHFLIMTETSDGLESQVGAVWKKKLEKIGKDPLEFFSLTFDDPSFPHSLNVAAFKNSKIGEWNISWRRRQVEM